MGRALALTVAALLAGASAYTADAIRVTTHARAIEPGEMVELTAITAEPLDTLHVRAFDRDVAAYRIDALTWQALVGIDLATKVGSYAVSFEGLSSGRSVTATTTLQVRPHAFTTRVLRVDDAYVNPPPPVIDRITREAAEIARLWTMSAPERLWTDGFVRPVPGRANSAFGSRSVFNGQPRQPHGGADFLSPAGTPILAPNSGRIVLARDLYFTGNTVIIDHGLGILSLLAHLSVIDVREGMTIQRGEKVGEVGATGRVTGPHLHWAIRMNDARVDPLSVLATLDSSH